MRSAPILGPRTNTFVPNRARELSVSIPGSTQCVRQFRRAIPSEPTPNFRGPVVQRAVSTSLEFDFG
jgi:hypothetical protein